MAKKVDSLAAEWPAKTNYLYLTYGGSSDDVNYNEELRLKKVIVLGSGPYRIGSSVEFDWCCVNTVWSLRDQGIDQAIIINCNPETVSTDYDISDKLYFEELTLERVLDIYEKERPLGVIVSMGGQIPHNMALKLSSVGAKIIGTRAVDIDRAEDRAKFSSLLAELGLKQPKWRRLTSIEEALKFAEEVGYPVLVRPSYVLSGSAMRVAYSPEELRDFLFLATKVSREHPVVISKFIEGAKEVEVDAVSDGESVFIGAVIEHVDNAGIHSGDSTMCIPPLSLNNSVIEEIKDYSEKIARALRIRGPFNLQFIVKDEEVFVIECNIRASRSMPYVSKVTGVNLIKLAVSCMFGFKLKELIFKEPAELGYFGVKAPQFSFMRLTGADPTLGVEMKSTGEVACIDKSFAGALLKAQMASEQNLPISGSSILVIGSNSGVFETFMDDLREMSCEIFMIDCLGKSTRKTEMKILEFKDAFNYLKSGKIDLLIDLSPNKESTMAYKLKRLAIDFGIPLLTSEGLIKAVIKSIKEFKSKKVRMEVKSLNEYLESLPWTYGFDLLNDLKG